jgi:hypothetical protein
VHAEQGRGECHAFKGNKVHALKGSGESQTAVASLFLPHTSWRIHILHGVFTYTHTS